MYANIMRLAKDVTMKKVTVNGEERSVLNNRVAITDGDRTTFIDITAWGALAELIDQYLKKGSEFYGEGELRSKNSKVEQADGSSKEYQSIYLQLDRIKFTYGNKKQAEKTGQEGELKE